MTSNNDFKEGSIMKPDYFVHPDIAKAETINKDIYLSADIFAEAKEKIFAPSWQFVCDVDQVRNPGTVFPFTLHEGCLDEPLFLSRDQAGALHCLSNVCTHRGNLLVGKACSAHQLVCKYHGRRFNLDGTFSFMPEFKEVVNFPTSRDHLTKLPVFQWG